MTFNLALSSILVQGTFKQPVTFNKFIYHILRSKVVSPPGASKEGAEPEAVVKRRPHLMDNEYMKI